MFRTKTQTLTGTTPAAPGNAVVGVARGLARYSYLRIDAALVGATGGALDLYLQRQVGPNLWADWLHFTQLASGAAAIKYTCTANDGAQGISAVGNMSDDLLTGSFVLAAGQFTGGLPGDEVRLVAVAGSGTSAGAAVTISITGFELYT